MEDRAALSPGEEIDGRYRVIELLGRGGMGEVYRAHDSRFGRTVAIKAMTGAIASDPRARRRFVREAQDAARVVHPYVATVLDVVDRSEGPLLIMEHIPGRSLDRLLAEGPLGLKRAARYALEIAEALAAIHQVGIVHRDLKPSNVMITPQDHVKVMDFGLAQRTAEASRDPESTVTVSETGRIAGTLPYMAPEQLRGAEADPRADLFSLGVILFEFLTGGHPFRRPTAAETVGAILHEPPGSTEDRVRLVAVEPLGATVLKLLEKDPGQRFESAAHLVDRLEQGGSDARPPSRRWTKAVRTSAASIVLVAAAIGAIAVWRGVRPGAPRIRAAVAVLPFEDRSGAKPEEGRGTMVADLLGAALGESSRLRAVDVERVRDALSATSASSGRLGRLERVRQTIAPSWIIAGTLYREGVESLATVEIYDGSLDKTTSFQVRASGSAELAEQMASRIGRSLGSSMAASLLPGRPAPSFSASEESQILLRRARELVRRLDYAAAIPVLENALEQDRHFFDAEVLLAAVLGRSGYEGRARETIQRALQNGKASALDEDSRQWLEAKAVFGRLFEPAEAIPSLRRLADLYPDEPETLLALADVLRAVGSAEEAIPIADRALRLDANDPRAHLSRARALAMIGRRDDADEALGRAESGFRALELTGGLAEVAEARAYAAYQRGDYEEAAARYGEAGDLYREASLPVQGAMADKSVADMALKSWRTDEAAAAYARVLPRLEQAGQFTQVVQTLGGLGGQLLRAGDVVQAEQRLREGRDEARKLGSERLYAVPVLNLAALCCVTGRPAECRKLAEEVGEISDRLQDPARGFASRLIVALSLRQEGKLRESLALLEELERGGLDPKTPNPVRRASLLGHVAQTQELLERPSDALATVSRALDLAREKPTPESAFHHACRSRVLAQLGRLEEAGGELKLAESVAGVPATIPEVQHMLARTRASLAYATQDWAGILEVTAAPAPGASYDLGALGALRAEALYRLGRHREAARTAGEVRTGPWSAAWDRLEAGRVQARALERLGRRAEASALARGVLFEAASLDVPLTMARAAALLASLRSPADPAVAEQGTEALERYVGAAGSGRDKMSARWDVEEVAQGLRGEGR